MADDQRADDLYERDFYLWTQAQAEALRAEARRRKGGSNAVDWSRVAEEIEDMGKSDLRECASRVETIIEHLFKLAWSQASAPRPGWEATILRERNALDLVLTPSLRAKIEAGLSERHAKAVGVAERAFAQDDPGAPRDVSLCWTLHQVLGERDDPLA